MGYLVPMIVVVIVGFGVVKTWLDHRREEPLRRELMNQEVTFCAKLNHVRVLGTGGLNGTRGQWVSLKGPMSLLVRTGGFEVVCPINILRLLFGMEYRFQASEALIEMSQVPSRFIQSEWIVVSGQKGHRDICIAMTTSDSLDSIWHALTGIGVHTKS
jgi:hypothetical protein